MQESLSSQLRQGLEKSWSSILNLCVFLQLLLSIALFGVPGLHIWIGNQYFVGWRRFSRDSVVAKDSSLPTVLFVVFVVVLLLLVITKYLSDRVSAKRQILLKLLNTLRWLYYFCDAALIVCASVAKGLTDNPKTWASWNDLLIIAVAMSGPIFGSIVWSKTLCIALKAVNSVDTTEPEKPASGVDSGYD